MMATTREHLEGLKTQYELQVANLKEELDKERKLLNTTMPAVKTEREDMLARIKEKHKEAISELRANLDPAEQVLFDRLRDQLNNAHDEEIQYLKNEYADELKSQIDALQTTMQQVNSGQLELVKTELEIEKTQHAEAMHNLETKMKEQLVESQKEKDLKSLMGEGDTSKILEVLKGQLSSQHQDMLEKICQDFEEKYVKHIDEVKTDYATKLAMSGEEGLEKYQQDQAAELSKADALKQEMLDLRSRLQAEFDSLMELKNDVEKARLINQSVLTAEMEKLTSQNRSLLEKYEQEVQELREQLDEKENSDEDEFEELFKKLRDRLSVEHQRQLRDLGQEFDVRYQQHIDAVKRNINMKQKGGEQEGKSENDGTSLKESQEIRNELLDIHSRLQGEYDILLELKSEMLSSQSSPRSDRPDWNDEQILIEKYQTELSELKTELENMRTAGATKDQDHEKELTELHDNFEKDLKDKENEYKQTLNIMETRYEEMIEEFKSREEQHLTLPLVTITASSDPESSPEGSPVRRGKDYIAQLEEKVEGYEEQLKNLRIYLETEHQCEVEELKFDYESRSELEIEKARLDMEDQHAKEMEALELKHQKELGNLQKQVMEHMENEMKEAEEMFDKEVKQRTAEVRDELKNDHEKALEALKQEHEEELQELRDELQEEFEGRLEEKEYEVEATMAEKYEDDISDLQHTIREQRAKLEKLEEDESGLKESQFAHQEELTSVRENLTHEWKKEVETLKSEFEVQKQIEITNQTTLLKDEYEEKLKNLRSEKDAEIDHLVSELKEIREAVTEKENLSAELEEQITLKEEELARLREETEHLSHEADHLKDMDNSIVAYENQLAEKDLEISKLRSLSTELGLIKSAYDEMGEGRSSLDLSSVSATPSRFLSEDEVEKLRVAYEERLNERDEMIRQLRDELDAAESPETDSRMTEDVFAEKDEVIERLRQEDVQLNCDVQESVPVPVLEQSCERGEASLVHSSPVRIEAGRPDDAANGLSSPKSPEKCIPGFEFNEGDSIDFDRTGDYDSGLTGTESTFEVTGSADFVHGVSRITEDQHRRDLQDITLLHQSEMKDIKTECEDRCLQMERDYKEQLDRLQQQLNESNVQELNAKIDDLQRKIEEQQKVEAEDLEDIVEKMQALETESPVAQGDPDLSPSKRDPADDYSSEQFEADDSVEIEEDLETAEDEDTQGTSSEAERPEAKDVVDFTVHSERMQELQNEIDKLRNEVKEKEQELEAAAANKTETDKLQNELKDKEGQLEEAVAQKVEIDKELGKVKNERNEIGTELEELKKEVLGYKTDAERLPELEKRLDELIEEARTLREELDSKNCEVETLKSELERAKTDSAELLSSIDELKSKLAQKDAELEASMEELDRYRQELDQLRKSHREEVEQYESNIRMLEQQYDVKMVEEDYNDKVRALEKNYAERVDTIRRELKELYDNEKSDAEQKHRQERDNLEMQLSILEQKIKDLEAEVESKQTTETSELEDMKQSLQKQYDDQLALGIEKEQTKFLEEHQQMVNKFAEAKEKEMTELEETLQAEKQKLEESHQKQLSTLKDQHAAELDAMKSMQEATTPETEQKLQALKEQYEKDLENMKMKLQEDVLADQRHKLEEMTAEMETSRNEEIKHIKQQLNHEHQVEVERFRVALDNKEHDLEEKLREVETKHLDELRTAKEESKKRIDEELLRLLDAHQQEIRAITLDNEREKSDLEEAHCQEIIDLRDKLKRNHLHDLDEIEQHYKNEFDELEKHHTEEMEMMKLAHDEEKAKLRKQIDLQIQEKISVLQQELNIQKAEMESHREEADKHAANMKVFREFVENCMRIEEIITKRMAVIVASPIKDDIAQESQVPEDPETQNGDDPLQDASMASADDHLSLSQHLCESLFVTPGMEDEDTQMLADSSSRLQSAVEKLLEMVATTTAQLQDSQKLQQHLLEGVEEKETEVKHLQELLDTEKEQKAYLAEELNKTEGILGNLKGEKEKLENGLTQLVQDKHVMDHELETTRNKLQDLEDSQTEVYAMKDEIERQRQAIEGNVSGDDKEMSDVCSQTTHTSAEQGLLVENQRLAAEKRDLQQQFNKDRDELEKRIVELEMTVEELQIQNDGLSDDKCANARDLQLQIETLEERLKSTKQFLEEQTAEREQEREEYEREKGQLHEKLKEKAKDQQVESRLQRELDDVLDQLHDKTDQHSEILLKKEQLEHDLQTIKLHIHELEDTICHLEAEISTKLKSEEDLKRKIVDLELELAKQQDITEELVQTQEQHSTSKKDYDAIVSDLRAELDSKSRAEQLILKQKMELEQELDKMRQIIEDLSHDRNAFQTTINDQLLQISTLKSSLDQLRYSSDNDSTKADMQRALDVEKEMVEQKDKELGDLVDQVETFRAEVLDKDNHSMQLQLQIEAGAKELEYLSRKHQEQLDEVSNKNESLETELKKVKEELNNQEIPPIAQVLINSKNEEIDELNEQVEWLEKQLAESKGASEEKDKAEKLAKDLEKKTTDYETLEKELEDIKQTVEELKEEQDLARHLQADGQVKDEKIEELSNALEKIEQEKKKLQSELTAHRTEEANQLNVLVSEKEESISQLTGEIDSLTAEVRNLTEFQQSLQDDYDTIHNMLEEKQAEVETLSRELMETRPPIDGASIETQETFEKEVAGLKKDLKEKQNVIDEKEEELYELKEKIENQEIQIKMKDGEIVEKSNIVDERKQALDKVEKELLSKDEKIADLNRLVSTRDEELAQLSRDVSNKENEIVRLLQQTPDASGDMDRPDTVLLEFKNKVEEQRKAVQELRDQVRDMKEVIRTKQQEVDKATSVGKEYKELLEEQKTINANELELVKREKDSKIHYLEEQLEDAKREAANYRSSLESASSQDETDGISKRDFEARLKQQLEEQEQKVKQEADVQIQEAQLKHSEEMAKLKEKHNLDVTNLTSQIQDELDKKYASDINQLRQQHELELKAIKRTIDENGSLTDIAKQLNAELTQSERLDSSLLAQMGGRKRQEGVGQEVSHMESFSSVDSSGLENQNDDHTIPDRLQVLLSRLHNEGVQVLTLSELQFIQQHRSTSPIDKTVDVMSLQQAWENEKQSLMEAVQALKDLLARTQHSRTPDKKSLEQISDWRADLVKAINFVFAKERESLLAELRTQVVAHPEEEVAIYSSLERKIKEQEAKHESAMDQIFSADRQSLLAEIRDLRAHMNVIRLESHEEKQRYANNLTSSEDFATKKERQLKSQIELLDYKLKQEKVLVEDLRSSLDSEKSRTIEISSQLGREKNRCTDLQSEMSNLQTKLTGTEEQFGREKTRLNTLLTTLEDERTKSNHLREALEIEQKNCEQYRDEAQKARRKSDVTKDRELKAMEKWKRELDSEKEQKQDALRALEQQRSVVGCLQRDLESERHRANKAEKEANAKANELRGALDMERAKCDEINSALQRERTLRAELRESLELERSNSLTKSQQTQSMMNDLQSRLDMEKSRNLDIASAFEREKKKVNTLSLALEGDRSQFMVDLEHERATCRQLKNNIDAIESQRQEVTRQLEFEKERATKLQADCDRQRTELLQGHDMEQEIERQREAERFKERQQRQSLASDAERERQRAYEIEVTAKELRQRVADLEFQLAESQRETIQIAQQHELEKMRRMQPSPDHDRTELEHVLKMHEKDFEIEQLKEKVSALEERHASLVEAQNQRPGTPPSTEQEQIIKDQALRLHEKDSEVRLQRKKICDLEQNLSQARNQLEEISEELQQQRKQALTSTPIDLERDRNDLRRTLKLQEKDIELDAMEAKAKIVEEQLVETEKRVADLEQRLEAERKQNHEKGIEVKKLQHKLQALEMRLTEDERRNDLERTSELMKEMLTKDEDIQQLKFRAIELEERLAQQQTDAEEVEEKLEREKQRRQRVIQKGENREQELLQKLLVSENETTDLRRKIVELEFQSAANDRRSIRSPRRDLNLTENYVTPMKRFELSMEKEDYVAPEQQSHLLNEHSDMDTVTPVFSQRSGPSPMDTLGHLEVLRQKLQMLVLKHKEEVSKTKHRLADDGSHRSAGHTQEMLILSKTLDNILTELQNLQASLSSDSGVTDLGRIQLNERVLHQNEELLHFVARISKEKQELRDTLSNLEEEIWRYRQREASMTMAFKPRHAESSVSDSQLTSERAQWSRERAQISLALHNSERELHKLKKDLRQRELELEIEREKQSASFSTPSPVASQPDQEKMQRLYGHYLRAESYRKNLVYQKKYLLSLIGGFRDTEVETLQMLAKMGAYPSERDLKRRSRHSKAMTKFRGAVRAVIALSRLRYLMKKWKRVKRVGSSVIAGSLPSSSTTYIPNSSSFFPTRTPTTHTIGSSSPVLESGRVHATPTPHRESYSPRHTQFISPPTRDESHPRPYSQSKSSPDTYSHRQIYPGAESVSSHRSPSIHSRSGDLQREERSLDQFIQKLEHLQQKLGNTQGSRGSSSRSSREFYRR